MRASSLENVTLLASSKQLASQQGTNLGIKTPRMKDTPFFHIVLFAC